MGYFVLNKNCMVKYLQRLIYQNTRRKGGAPGC
jgi:hypothetical protein